MRVSWGAPTVKKLGVSNTSAVSEGNTTASKAVTPKKASTATTSATPRASSVRLLGTSTKSGTKSVAGTVGTKTTGVANTERLSAIGKNLIKTKAVAGPNYSGMPQTAAVENTELMKRVQNLESKIEEISDLPETIAEIQQDIGDLNDKVDVANLSSNYYTIGQTQDYLEQNYYTKAYVDSIVSQLSGANVVSQFNPSFLHQNTGN